MKQKKLKSRSCLHSPGPAKDPVVGHTPLLISLLAHSPSLQSQCQRRPHTLVCQEQPAKYFMPDTQPLELFTQ